MPSRRVPNPSEMRQLIPSLGLTEYWYPALLAAEVDKRKPVSRKLLGQELAFFRGADGDVRAIQSVCPHRGALLGRGDCHYPGTVSCPYHGWTFDEHGECVAVLSEGPESKIPGKVQARTYPTRSLKGLVWVWMGHGEPADAHEDIPPEFFEGPDTLIFVETAEWAINWRPTMENSMDSHVPYLHRDALFSMLRPHVKSTPRTPLPSIVNGRAIIGVMQRDTLAKREKGNYRDFHEGVQGYWPKHRWRLLWSWLFNPIYARKANKPPFHPNSEEWGGFLQHHLPAMFRLDARSHLYSRIVVPVDEGTSRMVYIHAAHRGNPISKAWECAYFYLWRNWAMNNNFSRQDLVVMEPQHYDWPEKLSGTDTEVIAWRKLLLRARGMPPIDLDE